MKAIFASSSPNEIEYRLEVTMTLKEWKELKSQLTTSKFVSNRISDIITDVVWQAEKTFYPVSPEEEK